MSDSGTDTVPRSDDGSLPDNDPPAPALLLPDETADSAGAETLRRRGHILEQLRALPDEAFTRLQYLQPQVGCFNRCSFCSQYAGTEVWQLTRRGLRDLFAALHGAVSERPSIRGRFTAARPHKPQVLFPYFDNDIASYNHLDQYVELASAAMGCQVRLTTVGYSSRNAHLTGMHHRIATELSGGVSGMRFSVTPFTHGWRPAGERTGETTRADFFRDLTEALRTYRPLVGVLGPGKESVCVELRFRPLAVRSRVTDTVLDGHHVVAVGPHLLVSRRPADGPPELARVVGVASDNGTQAHGPTAAEPVFSVPATPYLLVTSDLMAAEGPDRFFRSVRNGAFTHAEHREVDLYRTENADGPYYALDPGLSGGSPRPLQIYPATDSRAAGYNDATRHFLRTLLAYKAGLGIGRRGEFPEATARDIARVLHHMRRRADELGHSDAAAAAHLRTEILPLVRMVAGAVLASGLAPSLFFSRGFTIDTGQAANHGRGRVLFKGLAGHENEPISPWEERSNHLSTTKGHVWRIAPVPFSTVPSRLPGAASRGGKNQAADRPALVVQEVDARYVQPTDHRTGQRLREFRIEGVEVEHLRLDEGREQLLFPGLREPAHEQRPSAGGATPC